jgi:hypothetical protein
MCCSFALQRSLDWVELLGDITHRYVHLAAKRSDTYMFGLAIEDQHGYSSGIVWSHCKFNVSFGSYLLC